MSTKLHALVADECTPLIIRLSPGQSGDAPGGRDLLRRLKLFRRVATRYDKLDLIFLSLIHLDQIRDALHLL